MNTVFSNAWLVYTILAIKLSVQYQDILNSFVKILNSLMPFNTKNEQYRQKLHIIQYTISILATDIETNKRPPIMIYNNLYKRPGRLLE